MLFFPETPLYIGGYDSTLFQAAASLDSPHTVAFWVTNQSRTISAQNQGSLEAGLFDRDGQSPIFLTPGGWVNRLGAAI